MSFKRSNKMTVSEQKNVSELFALIEQSNDTTLQELVDHRNLVRTFSATGMDEEQEQFEPSESNVSNAQRHYDSEKQRLRNLGTNGNTFDKNRAEVMRESRNATPLSDLNSERSKDFSSFSKHPDQPSLNSSVVFDSFREGSRQHRRA